MNTVATFEKSVQQSLARVIVGAEDVVRALCIALLARGHVLVQGPPGLGKTLLAKTLARVLGGEFKRVQGTADLMPSDIVGTHVFDSSKNEFVFRRGPLFADVLLVDQPGYSRRGDRLTFNYRTPQPFDHPASLSRHTASFAAAGRAAVAEVAGEGSDLGILL